MSSSSPPPILRRTLRVRPANAPGGRFVTVALAVAGVAALGRAVWLRAAARRFARLRGPRFDRSGRGLVVATAASPAAVPPAVERPSEGADDDSAFADAPVVDALAVEDPDRAAAEGPDPADAPPADAVVVDPAPEDRPEGEPA